MEHAVFEDLLERRLTTIKAVLGGKAKEYAPGGNRLHNFDLAAKVNSTTPEQALWGMATKHLVSVLDLVEGRTAPTLDLVDEKLGDMINYLILLEAVFKRDLTLRSFGANENL